MTQKLRIGVIFGGRSGEHEVSLVSATSVMNALNKEKYEVVPVGITPEGKWVSSTEALRLLKEKAGSEREPERFLVPEPSRHALMTLDGTEAASLAIDVIFPLVHGTYGEDGTLQGLLELADIPYVGAGVLGSALGMDKIVQKQLLAHAGLPIVAYEWFLAQQWRKESKRLTATIERRLRYPVFVKPANTGSSVGITKVHARRGLGDAVVAAAQYDRKIIVEQGVANIREIECSVLGNDDPVASLPGEIIPSNEFYDYDAKYVDGKSTAVIPARLPRGVGKRIRALAVQAFRMLDCAGMARVDFFLTRQRGRVYLNEINTIPGFTAISMYPKLWEATGLAFPELLDTLIGLAIERHEKSSVLRRTYRPAQDWYRS
jgi:D-alanine-D-alanine ligase